MENQNTFMNETKSSSTIPYTTHQNNDLNCNFFNPNWENSIDQNDPFESALSSMVSSPTATSNNGGENNIVQLRELIGRLGSICNSTNTSCYSTPLNSPPKLNLSTMENQMKSKHFQTLVPPFSTDPGFAQRAAKFSCFANNPNPGFNPILHSGSQDNRDVISDSMDNSSSVLEQNPGSRKRKSIPKGGKGKDTITPPNVSGSEKSESSAKKSKSDDKKKQENSISEDKKDYIHVRARRGQATDAHSLAERVRREKISERMKFLQDLVPGCNKVTGKAVMLDEIINYVQSLQRQVEFLSMKLATVDPRMDLNTEALMSKDIFQSRGSLPRATLYSSDFQQFETNNFNAALGRNQLSPFDNFNEGASQVSTFWEDDLHSIVQMGFGQNQTQNFQGIIPTTQMKVEL